MTNETGYMFLVMNPWYEVAGLFPRYETALESVRMSIENRESELDIRKSDERSSVGIWVDGVFICSIDKTPINNIAVGMTEL